MRIKNKKSAKDIAFDKERAKFRKQIRELEQENQRLSGEVADLKGMVQKRDAKIEELQDWVRRLLEYTELSEEEMRKIIQKDKAVAEIADSFFAMKSVTEHFI